MITVSQAHQIRQIKKDFHNTAACHVNILSQNMKLVKLAQHLKKIFHCSVCSGSNFAFLMQPNTKACCDISLITLQFYKSQLKRDTNGLHIQRQSVFLNAYIQHYNTLIFVHTFNYIYIKQILIINYSQQNKNLLKQQLQQQQQGTSACKPVL